MYEIEDKPTAILLKCLVLSLGYGVAKMDVNANEGVMSDTPVSQNQIEVEIGNAWLRVACRLRENI